MFEHIHDPKQRVRALCEYSSQVEIEPTIPTRRYFRSGHEMIRMASVYLDEGKLEEAFILYTKFITLFVEKLPKHPDYKEFSGKEKQANKQKLKLVFPKAESIKDKLTKKYEAEETKRQELEKKRAVELAKQQEEERRKEEKRKAELKKKSEEEDEKIRQQYGEQMIKEQEEQFRLLQEREKQKLREQEQSITGVTDRSPGDNEGLGGVGANMAGLKVHEKVPTCLVPRVPTPAANSVTPGGIPVVPPVIMPEVPGRHLKPSAPTAPPVETNGTQIPASGVPMVDRSNKPSHHFTSVGGGTNAYGLRTVRVPAELMVKFLNIAQSNTLQKLETGGFLFGKLSNEQFCVTHLIIIKQKGGTDSFTDLSDEDELWELQEKHDIVQLGWIHTHPTQTAFLSSVDQHVQVSFQCMLPESIAIVCSPKFEETGIFYLSPDYGLDFVKHCTGKGFHPHPSSPAIFETCNHAVIDPTGKVTVIDLRT